MKCADRTLKQLLLSFILIISGTPGAIAQPPKEFDVTSIKLNTSGTESYSVRTPPGGRYTATNIPVGTLILQAFDIKSFQLTGAPGWVDSERFDINARSSMAGTLKPEDLKVPVQELLASRFRLRYRRETKELPIYALVIAKSGQKLQANADARGPETSWGKTHIEAMKVPLSTFAWVLETQLGRHVADETGIQGNFDFKLTWTPDQSADTSGPSIFTALTEQYGLRLESRKGPVEVIVIDHIERPSEN